MEGGATALKPHPTLKPVSLPKAQAERSFHVFYELLAGLDPGDRELLSLQGPEAYYYLNQVGVRFSWMVSPDKWLSQVFQDAVEMPGAAPPQACCTLQGQTCRLQGKEDAQDFKGLVKALQVLGLCAEELSEVWAVLATILHLGNICFSSSEVGSLVGSELPGWAVTGGLHNRANDNVSTKPWAASGSRQIPVTQTRTVSPGPPAAFVLSCQP